MSELSNFIRFNDDGTLSGNIAPIAYDIDIAGEAFTSTNDKAPTHRIFAKSPRGRRVELGGIWKKKNQTGGDYYSLSISTGHGRLNANLGRYPGQDDEDLMAVIPWE
ncbi:DUF736 family protein [Sinorhizobium meliloti]|uniref:DUF736 domain-containing protein n=1 Tax=Rhizobium meliloti TaxID=382 RepID=UPI000FDA9DB9|nr:DUF736 family protein [Sinorhizobium meliloti]MDW9925221.1 DUF736 family protein [Sinorhizobium meliloti]MDX0036397.1 DUF736 family protein [Sinorhizobium meliloti]RVK22670.1 DUF736 family protein [Sinorhizobium meliloti]